MRHHPKPSLAIVVGLICAALAPAAQAATTWSGYSLFNGRAAVEGGTGTHNARLTSILLPSSFHVRRSATRLRFGPVGGCRSTGTVTLALVDSSATTAAGVLAEQVAGGKTYGEGRRGDAVFRIARLSGGKLKGAYVRPTRIARTWVVVRVATTPLASCHTGGVRESLGFPLADALAVTHASGY